ncbi:thiocillin family RiPP [Streptomyces lavendulae]|uniref:thiocillin family RiPP n=1 Tax=Streptomyces lavendulae TaxID=1914 RepID=UPI00331D5FAE
MNDIIATEEMFDLYALDGDLAVEELPEGNALGCWFSASSASTASCPATSAASVGSASTFG